MGLSANISKVYIYSRIISFRAWDDNNWSWCLFFKIIFQVKNADNYGWEPRRVLDQLTDIYLHLDSDVFAQALAADERSFRFELFEEAAVRLERALIKAPLQVC